MVKILAWLFVAPFRLLYWIINEIIRANKPVEIVREFPKYTPAIKEVPIDERTNICPYCEFEAAKIPESKTICKNCGEPIYVRTTLKNKKVTCTESQKNRIDQELKDDRDLKRLKEWVINQVWVEPQSEVYEFLTKLKLDWDNSGQKYRIIDLEWSLYQEMVARAVEAKNYFSVSGMYKNLTRIDEQEGRDPMQHLKEAERFGKLEEKRLTDNYSRY